MEEVCSGSARRSEAGRSMRPISESQRAVDPGLQGGQIVNYPGGDPRCL
jgi:hypothetical protein